MSPARPNSRVDRRQLLIDSARTLFAERPYDQVTTSEIAKRASVAYGLIAHHFKNKRGLYLAVKKEVAQEIAAVQLSAPLQDAPLADQLRQALLNHISYIDSYGETFVALVRGNLGSDPEYRAALDELRWQGVQRALVLLRISEPVPPVLRTALLGTASYLDEIIIDRIINHDLEPQAIVELAVAHFAATLQTVARLDPSIAIPPAIIDALHAPPTNS